MKNTELKFFTDTTVIISAITGRNKDAWILLESGKKRVISLFVNEFVIKEIRRALIQFDFSQENIKYAIDYVSECCAIRKNVPRPNYRNTLSKIEMIYPFLQGPCKNRPFW